MTERHKRSRGISRADVQGISSDKRTGPVRGRTLPIEQGEIRAHLMRQDQIDVFVRRHFTWPGTLRLHRAAVGGDLWRTPENVFLSPLFVRTRLAGWICDRLRLARAAVWLRNRRLQLRTAVAEGVEVAVLTELLDVPLERADTVTNHEALCRAILVALRLREVIRCHSTVAGAQAMAARIAGAIGDYASTRSAIAEFTTALITLAIGAIVFQAVTPGVISMAPGVAEAVSRTTAIADFPLGTTLGGVRHGVFPVGPPLAHRCHRYRSPDPRFARHGICRDHRGPHAGAPRHSPTQIDAPFRHIGRGVERKRRPALCDTGTFSRQDLRSLGRRLVSLVSLADVSQLIRRGAARCRVVFLVRFSGTCDFGTCFARS